MLITKTCVTARSHNHRVAGRKPEAFTERENAAMRHVLKTLRDRHGWSQAETGRRLNIGQQAAGVILNKSGGFSRPTALALAVLCGFDSPESMLEDLGARADAKKAPEGWGDRDLAAGIARRLGYEERAIERVIAKYTDSRYASQPSRWWMDRIVHEAAELAAERTAAPPAPASEPGVRARRKQDPPRKATA